MRTTSRILRSLGLGLAVAALVGACGGGGPSEPPEAAAPPRTTVTAAAPEAPPATAWDEIVAGSEADGTIPKEVALQAFDLLVADLPGVEAPAGDPGPVHSGSAAIRWLAPYLDELTAAQLDAVHAAMGDPIEAQGTAAAETRTIETIGTRSTGRQTIQAVRPTEVSCTLAPHASASSVEGEAFRYLLDQEQALLEGELGFELGIPVYLTTSTTETDAYAWASAEAPNCQTDLATSCHVRLMVNELASLSSTEVRRVLVRELFHCYQARMIPKLSSPRASWIVEGFADFVGQDLHPEEAERSHFETYLNTRPKGLFSRSYDASGFFFHLKSFGGDPWGNYVAAYKLAGNQQQFDRLVGSARGQLELTFASVLAMEPDRGGDWAEPEAPPVPVSIGVTQIADNNFTMDVLPVANGLQRLEFISDIVSFDVHGDGYGRVGWDGAQTERLSDTSGVNYCTRLEGCECPSGKTPDHKKAPSIGALVAASAIEQTTIVDIVGMSLEEFCRTDCVVGVWISMAYTVMGPDAELTRAGGDGVSMVVEADGTVTWDFDNMGPLENTIDVGLEGIEAVHQWSVSRGAAFGVVEAFDGDWTTTDIDSSRMDGMLIDEFVGQIPQPPGPGAFFVGDGTYECDDEKLRLDLTHPVDGSPIGIMFEKS